MFKKNKQKKNIGNKVAMKALVEDFGKFRKELDKRLGKLRDTSNSIESRVPRQEFEELKEKIDSSLEKVSHEIIEIQRYGGSDNKEVLKDISANYSNLISRIQELGVLVTRIEKIEQQTSSFENLISEMHGEHKIVTELVKVQGDIQKKFSQLYSGLAKDVKENSALGKEQKELHGKILQLQQLYSSSEDRETKRDKSISLISKVQKEITSKIESLQVFAANLTKKNENDDSKILKKKLSEMNKRMELLSDVSKEKFIEFSSGAVMLRRELSEMKKNVELSANYIKEVEERLKESHHYHSKEHSIRKRHINQIVDEINDNRNKVHTNFLEIEKNSERIHDANTKLSKLTVEMHSLGKQLDSTVGKNHIDDLKEEFSKLGSTVNESIGEVRGRMLDVEKKIINKDEMKRIKDLVMNIEEKELPHIKVMFDTFNETTKKLPEGIVDKISKLDKVLEDFGYAQVTIATNREDVEKIKRMVSELQHEVSLFDKKSAHLFSQLGNKVNDLSSKTLAEGETTGEVFSEAEALKKEISALRDDLHRVMVNAVSKNELVQIRDELKSEASGIKVENKEMTALKAELEKLEDIKKEFEAVKSGALVNRDSMKNMAEAINAAMKNDRLLKSEIDSLRSEHSNKGNIPELETLRDELNAIKSEISGAGKGINEIQKVKSSIESFSNELTKIKSKASTVDELEKVKAELIEMVKTAGSAGSTNVREIEKAVDRSAELSAKQVEAQLSKKLAENMSKMLSDFAGKIGSEISSLKEQYERLSIKEENTSKLLSELGKVL